jgi:hypothetical protein
VVTFS